MLIQLGAQDIKDLVSDKKKNKKKGGSNNNDSENNDLKSENKLRKYVLVRIVDGEKKVLTSKEIEDFKKKFPEVSELLYNQKMIEELEQNAPEA